MGALVMRRGPPPGGFEGGGGDEAFIYGEETLANAICDLVEVGRSELIRDQPVGLAPVDVREGEHTLQIESPT
jgi:hypothetical protein